MAIIQEVATRVSASSLIGRAQELAELEAAYAEAAAGRATLAFLAGESGVGKSRLLCDFLENARAEGSVTFGGECVELGEDELPYAPLVAALRPLVREGDPILDDLPGAEREGLARLVPELGPAQLRSEPTEREAQQRPFEALLSLLERMAEGATVVLWLDDAHWADRSTRAFLAYLGSSIPEDCRLLALVAYRSDELHRRHPLRPLLAELGRGERVRRVDLSPFGREEMTTQLADILGADPAPDAVERLFERSEGNPLFTEELLAAGSDGRGGLPSTLRDALLLRIERLPDSAQPALRLLAAAGRADHRLLADASGLEEGALAEALREAVSAQVIVVGTDDRYGFRHALLREVIYDDLLPGERADLHLKLARALESRLAGSEDRALLAAAVAHHFHSGEDQREALRSALAAAREVEAVQAPGASAALLDRALALWRRVEEPGALTGTDHATLLTLAAKAHNLDADEPHALSLYEEALGEIDEGGDPHRVAGILAEVAAARWGVGESDAARDDLERALALLPRGDATPERARILEQKVRFLMLQGRYASARDAAGEALDAAEEAGAEGIKSGVLNRLGLALFFLGEEAEGDAAMRESVEIGRRSGSNDQLCTIFVNYADALHFAGRSEEAVAVAEQGESEIAFGDRSGVWIACTRSEILFDLGRWEEAEAALPSRTVVQAGTTRTLLLLRRATMKLGRGDLAQAPSLIEQVRKGVGDSVEPQYIAPAGALMADLERGEGDLTAARAVIDDAIDRIEFCSEDPLRLAQIAAAGATVEADWAERARDLGDESALRLALARAEAMAARAEAAAEAIDRALEIAYLRSAEAELARARREDAAGRAELAALAWEQLSRPYPAAQQRWRQAAALAADGDREAAGEIAAGALASARELGSVWLAEEVEGLIARARLGSREGAATESNGAEPNAAAEDPFGLTPRERQVLAAVAGGATNREIAAELFMAEKTASVHVSRILTKLGVRSRTEAAAVAYRNGLTRA